jgi:hypothetical protein
MCEIPPDLERLYQTFKRVNVERLGELDDAALPHGCVSISRRCASSIPACMRASYTSRSVARTAITICPP